MFRSTLIAGAMMLSAWVPAANAQVFLPHTARYQNHQYLVQVRTWGWHERTFTNHREAHEFANYQRSHGHDATVNHHGQHVHVRFRGPSWETYRVTYSHAEAHALERLLEFRGHNARIVHQ